MTSPPALTNKIFILRGQKVMLDFHLAKLYEVETRVLNQAVKRNIDRFPEDFMFQLTQEEYQWFIDQNYLEGMQSQIVTASEKENKKRNLRARPYAFTEHGIAMLSGVLRSSKAIEVNIAIMRAFIKMRYDMMNYAELSEKLLKMEQEYDDQFHEVFDALRALMEQPIPEKPSNPIGYIPLKEHKNK